MLAEFPSAVDAVRCAIDIQESLRTRNMAYPPSRQMSFRIGITIGDVVERNGDLLGDGVNIAARLEGLAEVGGICVSRAVHEQVANKLSVQFADIGAQEVKNIPTPVHAYMVAMRREDGTYATPKLKKPACKLAAAPVWMWPLVVAVVSVVAIGLSPASSTTPSSSRRSPPRSRRPRRQVLHASAAPADAVAPSPMPTQMAKAPMAPMSPAGAAIGADARALAIRRAAVGQARRRQRALHQRAHPQLSGRRLFRRRRLQGLRAQYRRLHRRGVEPADRGSRAQHARSSSARSAPMPRNRRGAASSMRSATTVVYTHGKPPMPPQPWVRHDAMTERAFVAEGFSDGARSGKVRLENMFVPAAKSRAIALGPGGQYFMVLGASSVDDSARRSLESCGAIAGVACLIVAVDDNFVVPIPTLLRITGFFHAATNASIAADARAEVVRKLADGMGWNAVAVGTAGRPGLGLKAADEQTAVNSALADCAKRDSDCHVIAIGPFTVGPTN